MENITDITIKKVVMNIIDLTTITSLQTTLLTFRSASNMGSDDVNISTVS
jgi:hypothetical protein